MVLLIALLIVVKTLVMILVTMQEAKMKDKMLVVVKNKVRASA